MAMFPTALECPCFSYRHPHGRRAGLATGAAFAMAAWRGGGRHGPPFARWGGGPFGGRGAFPGGRRARRGDIRAAALLLLAEESRNGYQIIQEIEKRSDGLWKPSPGSVYPALAQLEDEGLVRAQEVGDRRTYVLTDAGRAYIEEHRDELTAPWEQMADSVDDDVGALFRELRHVGMAAAQIGHLGNTNQIAKARSMLAAARRGLYSLLAEDENDE
jgi:DNA-binding PadR family transcriptional regulator